MLNTCIILNGPPNSGKDTLADLMGNYGYRKHMMKDVLYSLTAAFFNIYRAELFLQATDRSLKDIPWEKLTLDGKVLTPREALIHVSETEVKPKHGPEYFGKVAAEDCVTQNHHKVVFSDGGFAAEVSEMDNVFNRVFIFQLYRYGCTFDGDSRSYLTGFKNTHKINLVNDKPWLAVNQIFSIINTE